MARDISYSELNRFAVLCVMGLCDQHTHFQWAKLIINQKNVELLLTSVVPELNLVQIIFILNIIPKSSINRKVAKLCLEPMHLNLIID